MADGLTRTLTSPLVRSVTGSLVRSKFPAKSVGGNLLSLLSAGDALYFNATAPTLSENAKSYTLPTHGQVVSRVYDQGPSMGDNRLMRGGWCADFSLNACYGKFTSNNSLGTGADDIDVEFRCQVPDTTAGTTYVFSNAEDSGDISWRAGFYLGNVRLVTYAPTSDLHDFAHGKAEDDWVDVKIERRGTQVEVFIDGNSIGTDTCGATFGDGPTLATLGARTHTGGGSYFAKKIAEVKITVGSSVVYWVQPGAGEDGDLIYNIVDSVGVTTMVNRPAGFQVQDSNVTWNAADDLGYKLTGAVVEPAAYQTDGTTALGTTAAGGALTYSGRCPRSMPISRTVLDLGATSYVLIPAMSPTSGASFSCYVKTTATSGDLLSDGASNQSLSWSSGGTGSINASNVQVDGSAFAGNDGALYTAVADGAWHFVEWDHDVSGWSARRISSGFLGQIADFVIDDTGTLAHWPLQEASGTNCVDLTGNYDGTLTNTTGTDWDTQSDEVPCRALTEGTMNGTPNRVAASGETPDNAAYTADALNSLDSLIALPESTAVREFDTDLDTAYATSATDATPGALKESASPTNNDNEILRANAYNGEIVMLGAADAGKASSITTP